MAYSRTSSLAVKVSDKVKFITVSIIIFLNNDVENYLLTKTDKSLNITDSTVEIFLKVVIKLYADDAVILLRIRRSTFAKYSTKWKLNVDYNKTKVLFFGDRNGRKSNIYVNNNIVEKVEEFKMLGVLLTKNRHFAIVN